MDTLFLLLHFFKNINCLLLLRNVPQREFKLLVNLQHLINLWPWRLVARRGWRRWWDFFIQWYRLIRWTCLFNHERYLLRSCFYLLLLFNILTKGKCIFCYFFGKNYWLLLIRYYCSRLFNNWYKTVFKASAIEGQVTFLSLNVFSEFLLDDSGCGCEDTKDHHVVIDLDFIIWRREVKYWFFFIWKCLLYLDIWLCAYFNFYSLLILFKTFNLLPLYFHLFNQLSNQHLLHSNFLFLHYTILASILIQLPRFMNVYAILCYDIRCASVIMSGNIDYPFLFHDYRLLASDMASLVINNQVQLLQIVKDFLLNHYLLDSFFLYFIHPLLLLL